LKNTEKWNLQKNALPRRRCDRQQIEYKTSQQDTLSSTTK